MVQAYSDPAREDDPHALPDIEVFELTAREVIGFNDPDLISEYLRRPEFRLATMSGRVRDAMLDAIIAEQGITGGWFWYACFPGCLPDGDPSGPFATREEALADARDA